MGNQCNHHRKKQRARVACILCLFIIMLLVILLVVLYFVVFKPQDPRVRVPVMQMMSYNATGAPPSMTAVSLGLDLHVSIYNPNRGDFYIEDASTATLYYGGAQLGVTSLPINSMSPISSLSSINFGITLAMQSPIYFNMSAAYTDPGLSVPMPISTFVTVYGHVTTAGGLSHHSIVVSTCDVNIALARPRTYIQSYVCMKSHPVNG